MDDEPRINLFSAPIATCIERRAIENKPADPTAIKDLELDRRVAQADPEVRRRIVRNEIDGWVMAVVVSGVIAPIVFGVPVSWPVSLVILAGAIVWFAFEKIRRT